MVRLWTPSFDVLLRFDDHDGFDGLVVGCRNAPYHLEFTRSAHEQPASRPDPEDLLVFYLPQRKFGKLPQQEWNGPVLQRSLHLTPTGTSKAALTRIRRVTGWCSSVQIGSFSIASFEVGFVRDEVPVSDDAAYSISSETELVNRSR